MTRGDEDTESHSEQICDIESLLQILDIVVLEGVACFRPMVKNQLPAEKIAVQRKGNVKVKTGFKSYFVSRCCYY